MTSIGVNGVGTYQPALVNQGCSNGIAPKRMDYYVVDPTVFRIPSSVKRLPRIASNGYLC